MSPPLFNPRSDCGCRLSVWTRLIPPSISSISSLRAFLLQAHLIGLHCFHVRKHHYVAFVRNRGRGEWLLVDDDKVIPVSEEERSVSFCLEWREPRGALAYDAMNFSPLGVRFSRLSGLRHFDVSRRPGVDGGDAN